MHSLTLRSFFFYSCWTLLAKSGVQQGSCSATSYRDNSIEWSIDLCNEVLIYVILSKKCCPIAWSVFKNLPAAARALWFRQQYLLKKISQLLCLLHAVLTHNNEDSESWSSKPSSVLRNLLKAVCHNIIFTLKMYIYTWSIDILDLPC